MHNIIYIYNRNLLPHVNKIISKVKSPCNTNHLPIKMRQCLAHLTTMTLSDRRAQISLLLSTQHVFNNQRVKDGLLLSDLFGIGYLMVDSVLIPQR